MEFLVEHTWDGAAAQPGERVRMTAHLDGAGALHLNFEAPFHGDPAPDGPPGVRDGLWGFEVVEFFLVGADGAAPEDYLEVELGPRGHHLALRLRGERQAVARGLPVLYGHTLSGGRWRGRAVLAAEHVPPGPHRANAYAIHGVGPNRRYLCHTPTGGDRPDFHRLSVFGPANLWPR
jgi:hypothetical protein